MKLHSLQFKFLFAVISSMLAITLFIGALSIYQVDRYVQQQTETFVHVSCEKEAAQVNSIFSAMETSVNIMSGYILNSFDSLAQVKDPQIQKDAIAHADTMFADVASYTPGGVAYYLRFDPDLSTNTTGFFYSKTAESDKYLPYEITDLSLYEKDDTEHVGWYWQPYFAKKPVWMAPYHNKNNDITMISYVVPLYCEGRFIAVVGMDFDYNVLIDQVHQIRIYDHGFAHLEVDGVSVCHEADAADSYDPNDYLQVSADLANGMKLVLSASYDDIRQARYEIALRVLLAVSVLGVIISVITISMVKRIVKPLHALTEASKKLADGNYDVEPVQSDTYEIQLLSTAFENMSMHLREHEKLQHLLAYWDSMTGLRNTTSYKVWVTDFNLEIQQKHTDFGVIVLDVNYLKETNDRYGHDVGNKLIVAVARLIADIFKRSPVFRIGGDEFLVILQDRDLEEYEYLCKKFDAECAKEYINERIPVSIARGFARYNPETDTQFVDVFNRADDAMYQNKRRMKTRLRNNQLHLYTEKDGVL